MAIPLFARTSDKGVANRQSAWLETAHLAPSDMLRYSNRKVGALSRATGHDRLGRPEAVIRIPRNHLPLPAQSGPWRSLCRCGAALLDRTFAERKWGH